jgi:hypothetical protein
MQLEKISKENVGDSRSHISQSCPDRTTDGKRPPPDFNNGAERCGDWSEHSLRRPGVHELPPMEKQPAAAIKQ